MSLTGIADASGNRLVIDAGGGIVTTKTGALTNRSGTIATGGTAQQAAAANTSRRYLLIQAPTTNSESFWVRLDGNAAVVGSPSIEIAPGVALTFEAAFVPNGAISVIAATTGTPWTLVEG